MYKFITRTILIASIAALTACATSSGVSQLGKDTYTLSSGVAGSGSVSGNDTKYSKLTATMAADQPQRL